MRHCNNLRRACKPAARLNINMESSSYHHEAIRSLRGEPMAFMDLTEADLGKYAPIGKIVGSESPFIYKGQG